MVAPLTQDALFRWTEDGQTFYHYLGAKLRRQASNPVERVHEFVSADFKTTRRVTIGSGPVYDLSATIRYDGQPDRLEDFIAAGLRGAAISYMPSASNPSVAIPCEMVTAGKIQPDQQTWFQGRHQVDVVLRRTEGGRWSQALMNSLFYYRAGNPMPGLTFTRTGLAWYMDEGGVYQSAAEDIHRVDWSSGEPELLLELAATNDLLDSADVDVGDANWTQAGGAWTTAVGVSAIAGGVCTEYSNDGVTGSHGVSQGGLTLVSGAVVASAIIEQGDATESSIGLRDATAAGWIARAVYDWSTGVISVVDSSVGSATGARARTLRAVGPNGGKLVRVEVYGVADNPGNTGSVFLYPTGTSANANNAFVHHMQHEDGSVATSPIVTSGSAVTRNNETMYATFASAPQAMTVYAQFREIGSASDGGFALFQVGSSNGGDEPRLGVFTESANGRYRAHYETVAGTAQATPAVDVAWDEDGEVIATLSAAGQIAAAVSAGGAAETTGTGGTLALPAAWADTRVYLNSLGNFNRGLSALRSLKIATGVKSLAEMRAL